MTAAISQLRSQLNQLAAAQAQAQASTVRGGLIDPRAYRDNQNMMRDMRQQLIRTATATGGFNARSVSLTSEVDRFNEALAQNKLRMRDVVRGMQQWRNENSIARRALREQVALRNSALADWGSDDRGRRMGTLFIPRDVPAQLETTRMRMQYINQMIASAATNTVKWGKNMQWAGRQLMVGFTYPVALIGAGTAALAYQYEHEMARIIKVSEESSDTVRKNASETATFVAAEYGRSAKETLSVYGNLAAIGFEGGELNSLARETQRISFLGDLTPEDATKMITLLQTVYGMNPKQIKEAGDYMNALENATSLTMDDFVKGGPRIAAIMEEMGVSFQEMGVLLNGFKSAGIDAEEGARALRSVAFRTIAPRGHVLDTFKENTGKDLTEIIKKYKGEFLPTFMAIGEEIKNLDSISKSEIIRVLFGVEQGSKGMELMNQLVNSSGQMSRAWDVANQSTEQWGNTAERELKAYQESVAGRFKRALETVKNALVPIGTMFLELGVNVLNAFVPVFNFINNLPDGVKKTAGFLVVLSALLGPLIMMVGLFANATGNVVRFGTVLFGIKNRMAILNAEQAASARLTAANTGAFAAQTQTVGALTSRIQLLNAAIAQHIAMSQGMTLAAGTAGAAGVGATGAGAAATASATAASIAARYSGPGGRDAQGRLPSPAVIRQYQAATAAAAANTAATATSATAVASKFGLVARLITTAGLGMAYLAAKQMDSETTQGRLTQDFTKYALGVGLAASFMPGIASSTYRMVAGLGRATPLTRGLTNGFGRIMGTMPKILGSAIRFLGPVGLIAGGILLIKEFYDYTVKTKKQMEDIENSAKSWSEILGYDYQSNSVGFADEKDTLTEAQELDKVTTALLEKNKGLVDLTKEQKGDQEQLVRLAQQQAAMVMRTGGTREQANLAARALLVAAEVSEAEVKTIMMDVENINWKDPQILANTMMANVSKFLGRAMEENSKGSFSFKDWFRSGDDLTQGAGREAKLAGQAFTEAFLAETTSEGRKALFEQFDKDIEASTSEIMNRLKEDNKEAAAFMEARGINGPQALLSTIMATERAAASGDTEALDRLRVRGKLITEVMDVRGDEMDQLRDQAGLEKTVVKAILTNMNLTGKRAEGIVTLETLQRRLGLTDEQMADALNDATDELNDNANAARNAADAMDWLIDAGEEWAKQALPDARRATIEYAQDYILEEASTAHQSNFDAAMDGLRRRGEAELAALEDDADDIEAKYDRANRRLEDRYDPETGPEALRLRAIQASIKAEEDAEKVRERIFEAEKRRIQRLADLFNRNIDFNAALNAGDLDEAARVQSNATAQTAQWALEDQREDDPSKTKLDTLRELEKAEEEALDRRKERDQEALKSAQDAEKAALDAVKESTADRVKDREEGAQKMFDIEKKRLDRELAILRAFVPKNEAELKEWENKVKAIYDEFGVGYLEPTADIWGNMVGTGLEMGVRMSTNKLQTDAMWAQMAAEIANSITSVLGMSATEFMSWMRTGALPVKAMNARPNGSTTKAGQHRTGEFGGWHTGGEIPWSSKDRTGVPRSANLYPSEVTAVLKRGEFVVNKTAAQKNLGLLHHINEGKVDREGSYHSGGAVGGRNVSGATMGRRQIGLGGPAMAGGLMAGIMNGLMSAMAGKLQTEVMNAMGSTGGMMGGNVGAMLAQLGEGALGAILKGLRMQESSNNYKARSKISSASGAYQYIKSTWNGYGGYNEAWQAPPEIQDQRASRDLMNSFRRYGNWEQAIAHHFYPAWAGNRSKWGQAPGRGNPTVQDYVNGVLNKAGFGMSAGMGVAGGGFSAGGKFPPAVKGKVSANTAAAAAYIRDKFGIKNIGLLGNRARRSDHPMGKAADFMIPKWNTPEGIALGNAIASFFVQNPNMFGTKYVIWRQKINQGNGWKPMADRGSPTENHMDHPHVSFKHLGGEMTIPQLATGATIKRDNVLANLHKGERVLTAPLTEKLDEGLSNIGNGGGDTFTITVNGSADSQTKADFEKIVRNVLDERDKRNGLSRRKSG